MIHFSRFRFKSWHMIYVFRARNMYFWNNWMIMLLSTEYEIFYVMITMKQIHWQFDEESLYINHSFCNKHQTYHYLIISAQIFSHSLTLLYILLLYYRTSYHTKQEGTVSAVIAFSIVFFFVLFLAPTLYIKISIKIKFYYCPPSHKQLNHIT